MTPSTPLSRAISAFLLLSRLSFAAPVTPTLTAPATSGPTPVLAMPPQPPVLPLAAFARRFPSLAKTAAVTNDTASVVARSMLDGVEDGDLEKRARKPRLVTAQVQATIAQTCLDSSVSFFVTTQVKNI